MRSTHLLVVVCLLTSASALASDGRSDSDVEIQRAVVLIETEKAVNAKCGTPRGCTVFDGVTFMCECERRGEEWRLRVRTSAVPHVTLSSAAYLAHEFAHISDFQFLLEDALGKIRVRTFASEGACLINARASRSRFPSLLRDVARRTTALRDGRQAAKRMFPSDDKRAARQ
jgi:hypothetical protein